MCSTNRVPKLLDIQWKTSSCSKHTSLICSKSVFQLNSMTPYKKKKCIQSFSFWLFYLWYSDNVSKILDYFLTRKCISNSFLWEHNFQIFLFLTLRTSFHTLRTMKNPFFIIGMWNTDGGFHTVIQIREHARLKCKICEIKDSLPNYLYFPYCSYLFLDAFSFT